MTEELADVYEVLRSLASELRVSMAHIVHAADEKRNRVGGFDSFTVLTWGKP
jgi:predicted house-cleaning noncanonical NTP pyrophosphatase (MazG superfamily)